MGVSKSTLVPRLRYYRPAVTICAVIIQAGQPPQILGNNDLPRVFPARGRHRGKVGGPVAGNADSWSMISVVIDLRFGKCNR
jgi:hypothetical protein